MTSYLTSIDNTSPSRTVFEIFDFKVFWVWPWPSTPKGHLGSKNFKSFESSYLSSYLTSMDTISLSCTVLEIFDFEIFRVWPWPLTLKSHLGSKNFKPFESSYMIFYLTPMNTISLSRTILEIMPVKILKAEQNGGFSPFKGQGQESIFFYHRKGTSSHRTASFEILRIEIGSAVWWESDPFLELENIGQWPWPWKGQNPPFCLAFKILTGIISRTVRDREMMFMEVK